MRNVHLIVVFSLAVALAAAACGGGASSPATAAPPSEPPAGGPIRVEVAIGDDLRMDPQMMSVAVGVPVTFVVTNVGTMDHEFFLGSEAEQSDHGTEMATMGSMAHDQAMGMGLKPGVTKELTVTFDQVGTVMAGCHVAGHYLAGMKATIQVSG